MNKLNRFLSYLVVALAAAALTMWLTAPGITKLSQLEALIINRFIGESDPTAIEDAAAGAMIKSLGDRWSYYIPASEYASHQEQANNAYVGINILITKQEEEPAGLLIMTVHEGGGAYDAGLVPGDLITAIEGNPTASMTTGDARNLIRGELNTDVMLTILRDGKEFEVPVTRREILTPVATGTMVTENTGLITISNFDSRCAEEAIAAIETLTAQGAEKLIFDVRNNPGGYAHELVALLDYLLPEGILFHTIDYQGKEKIDRSDANFLDLPMVVLCNGDSYSAAEFFAAAMQEYEAAAIVGSPTCGKGYFQQTFELKDGSAVALSVGKYFTPKGESLIDVGIQPDVIVEVDEKTAAGIYYGTLAPMEDPQILAALEALEAAASAA